MRLAAVEGARRGGGRPARELDGALAPSYVEVLGPVELEPPAGAGSVPTGGDGSTGRSRRSAERALLRVPRADGRALAAALRAVQATRTARKVPDPVRIRLDPIEIG